MQSLSLVIGVQRQTEMNTIIIVLAGTKNCLCSRGLLNKLREPTTAEAAIWPAIKQLFEPTGDITDVLKDGSFQTKIPRASLCYLQDMHISQTEVCVCECFASLSVKKSSDYIRSESRPGPEKFRSLRADLPAVWSDNSRKGLKSNRCTC